MSDRHNHRRLHRKYQDMSARYFDLLHALSRAEDRVFMDTCAMCNQSVLDTVKRMRRYACRQCEHITCGERSCLMDGFCTACRDEPMDQTRTSM